MGCSVTKNKSSPQSVKIVKEKFQPNLSKRASEVKRTT